MQLHPSITPEDVEATFREVELSLGNIQILNSPENIEAILAWLGTNAVYSDAAGKGILPTPLAIKRALAELHRAGDIQYVAGHAPRTQEEIREAEEAKPRPEMLSAAEVRKQTQDAMKSATVMAGLRRRTETAAADVRSHYTKQKVRDGLKKFFEDFIRNNPVEKLTAAQAEAFEKLFNAEERRLFEEK